MKYKECTRSFVQSLTKDHSLLVSLERSLKKSMQTNTGQARGKKERKVCGELTMNQKEVEYTSILFFFNLTFSWMTVVAHASRAGERHLHHVSQTSTMNSKVLQR